MRLVVNTPTPRSGAVRDAAEIRLAATAEGILCLTAMETAVAAAEALDPTIAERLSEVRSLDEWVPRARTARPSALDAAQARPRPIERGRRSSGATTIAWPSDQSVSVVSADHDDRQRDLAPADRARRCVPGGACAAAFTCPAQAPSMWPPTTAASCTVQTSPGGSHAPDASWKAVPNRSQPCWNGSEIATTMFWPSMSR